MCDEQPEHDCKYYAKDGECRLPQAQQYIPGIERLENALHQCRYTSKGDCPAMQTLDPEG
jgi:hypothetical protein